MGEFMMTVAVIAIGIILAVMVKLFDKVLRLVDRERKHWSRENRILHKRMMAIEIELGLAEEEEETSTSSSEISTTSSSESSAYCEYPLWHQEDIGKYDVLYPNDTFLVGDQYWDWNRWVTISGDDALLGESVVMAKARRPNQDVVDEWARKENLITIRWDKTTTPGASMRDPEGIPVPIVTDDRRRLVTEYRTLQPDEPIVDGDQVLCCGGEWNTIKSWSSTCSLASHFGLVRRLYTPPAQTIRP